MDNKTKPLKGAIKKHYDVQTKMRAIQLYNSGSSYKSIAKQIGCSYKSVINWVRDQDRIFAIEAKGKITNINLNFKIPEVETMRKKMFDILQEEYVTLSTALQENTEKKKVIHHQMKILGEQWRSH